MAADADIRSFRWGDLEPFTRLFNTVNGITGTEKAFDAEFMRQVLAQPSCDPLRDCYVAEAAGSLVGYCLISRELPIGRTVAAGGVLEEHRQHGIERRLVAKAIEYSSSLNASVLHIEAPADGVEVRRMLESQGFTAVRDHWNMSWEDNELPTAEPPSGLSIRPFRLDQDEEALTALQNAAFEENWGFCPNTVDEISARVRFKNCDPDGIILVDDGQGLPAYNWTSVDANETRSVGRISMTGVHPDNRRMGLGKLVVLAGMRFLKSKGVDAIELQVDAENAAARNLYLSLGFERVAETVWYELSLGGHAD